jgi:hypothetical protein
MAGAIAYISPGLFGLIFGITARSLGSGFRRAGSQIWVAPLSLFAVAFLVSVLSNWREAFPEFFGLRGGETEEGIVAVLLTFPTAACCFYAIGIRLRKSIASSGGTNS